MTTIRQIVIDGFREAGIVGTDDEPEAGELEEGVRRVNTLISTLFGNELGEHLLTINYGKNGLTNSYAKELDTSSDIDSIYVPSNIRLILNLASAKTLYMHPDPQDGCRLGIIDNSGNLATYNATLNGNGRKIESANTVVLNTNPMNREWFYRADLGNWARVTELDVNDPSPLPREFDDFLSTLLAIRINPRYGATTGQETVQVFTRMRSQFRARYRQNMEVSVDRGVYYLPSSYPFYWGDSTAFNRGR